MPKRRKLNSKNPKYKKTNENDINVRKEFVHEVKGCKIYKLYYL